MTFWSEPKHAFAPPADFWGKQDFWAPEVHAYNGAFYMFATFMGDTRGTGILKADHPAGPFLPWSDGAVTPRDQMCLDGTLHIDKNGKPWIVYCHEWVQVGNGTMNAAPLSEDLKQTYGVL